MNKKNKGDRLKLIDRMIRIYGEDSPVVEHFIQMCDTYSDTDWNNEILSIIVGCYECMSDHNV